MALQQRRSDEMQHIFILLLKFCFSLLMLCCSAAESTLPSPEEAKRNETEIEEPFGFAEINMAEKETEDAIKNAEQITEAVQEISLDVDQHEQTIKNVIE